MNTAAVSQGVATRAPTLPALTGVRFFAAMAVLLFHYGAGFAVRSHAPSPVTHLLHNGFLGVSLFFVLSGFIITYSHFAQAMPAPAIRRFYWARIARIYPVYLLALLLALPVLTKPLPLLNALAVLTMTQAWTTPASHLGVSWVMQAWTLSIEAAFYILFPFYWPVVRRLGRAGTIGLAIACAAFIVAFGVPTVRPEGVTVPLLGQQAWTLIPLFRMAEFTYGMAICQIFMRWPLFSRQRPINARLASALEIGLALGLIAVLVTADSPQAKGVFTVLTGLFILVTAHDAGVVSRLMATPVLLLLGGASYGIYILQQPVHSLCTALLRAPYDQVISPIVTIAGAIAVYLFVEQPARRLLMGLVPRPD